MDFRVLLHALLRRKWWLILVPAITGIATLAYLINQNRIVFKSTAQLSTGYTITDQIKLVEEGFNLYQIDVKFNNLIEQINSTTVLSLLSYRLILNDLESERPFTQPEDQRALQLIASLDLERAKEMFRNKLDSMEVIDLTNPDELPYLQLLSAYGYDEKSLKRMLSISRQGFSDFVQVVAQTSHPRLSAFMVNTLCAEFLRFANQERDARSNQNKDFLATLVNKKQEELDQKQEALRMYKSQRSVINVGTESASKLEQIRDNETRMEEARQRLRSSMYALDDVKNRLKNDYNENTTRNNSSENAELIRIRNRINALNQRYISGGSTNKTLMDSINLLRSEQQRLMAATGNNTAASQATSAISKQELLDRKKNLEVEIAVAQQDIASYENIIRALRSDVGTYASKEATIAKLERDVELASEEYRNAQQKYSAAVATGDVGTSIKQITFGQPSIEPEPSRRMLITALAGTASFALCVFIVLIAELSDFSLKAPSIFRRNVDLPLIGTVPLVKVSKLNFKELFSKDIAQRNSRLFKEAIRKLRFVLESSNEKVFLVTSLRDGVGKTTLIHALSHALSHSGKRVLLIDTNFTHNTLSEHFKAEPVLEKFVTIPEQVDKAKLISDTGILGVDIIGCSGGAYSPAEILPKINPLQNLKQQFNQYDFIIMEGAGLNNHADARELSPYVDRLICVFSSDSTLSQTDRDSLDFLKTLEYKVSGTILNKVLPDNMEL